MRDGTALLKAGHQSPRQVSYAGWDRLAESGGIRALARVVVRDGTALLKVLLKAGASEVSSELF